MAERKRIYLDNAATSWPKPESVYQAVERYQRQLGAPAGRGTYREAGQVQRLTDEARRRVAELLAVADPRRIIFTFNGTDSLNLAIHGTLAPGDHVITSDAEHNSVLRPLRWLESQQDVSVTCVACDAEGVVDPDAVRAVIRPETKMIALIHASNVTGALQPVEEVGQIARDHGLRMLVDAAQTAGHVPLDLASSHADLVAAPGHKGLLAPLGTGILYVAPGVEPQLSSVRQGGTGTQSDEERQPESLPEKYESGNHNVPGLAGLEAALQYIAGRGLPAIREHQVQLLSRLLDGLGEIKGVRLFGPGDPERQIGVVSMTIPGYDPQEVAALLDSAYGIQVRAGLHCAPRMHRALGTAPAGGTVRLSLGALTTTVEIDAAVRAVAEIASTAVGV